MVSGIEAKVEIRVDLTKGVRVSNNEARLFCNLIRSYLSYLLTEHERMKGPQQT